MSRRPFAEQAQHVGGKFVGIVLVPLWLKELLLDLEVRGGAKMGAGCISFNLH